MDMILIIGLALFAIAALVVWCTFDIDVADIVATIGAPLAGFWLIYWYGTAVAWAAGFGLVLIGGFALYDLITRWPARRGK